MKCRGSTARKLGPERRRYTSLLISTSHTLLGERGVQNQHRKRQDPPFKEHSEGVLPETRLFFKDLFLENQSFAIPTVLLQSFAYEVQTCW